MNETVNIFLTQVGGNSADLTGATITITDDDTSAILLSTTWQGDIVVAEIEPITNYTISVGNVTGYLLPQSQQYLAKPGRQLTVSFKYTALGIYAYYSNGELKTYDEADSNAIGVAVLTSSYKFVIDKITSSSYLSPGAAPSTAPTGSNAYYTYKDWVNKVGSTEMSNFVYNRFGDNGYVGSVDEWMAAYNNKTSVQSMLTKIGGNQIVEQETWLTTCTFSSNGNYVSFGWNSAGQYGYNQSGRPGPVRAFLHIEI